MFFLELLLPLPWLLYIVYYYVYLTIDDYETCSRLGLSLIFF
jgi:hypothetical protein